MSYIRTKSAKWASGQEKSRAKRRRLNEEAVKETFDTEEFLAQLDDNTFTSGISQTAFEKTYRGPFERYIGFARSTQQNKASADTAHAFCVHLDLHGLSLNSGKKLCPGGVFNLVNFCKFGWDYLHTEIPNPFKSNKVKFWYKNTFREKVRQGWEPNQAYDLKKWQVWYLMLKSYEVWGADDFRGKRFRFLCAAYDRLGWRATKLLDIMCEDLVRGEPQTCPLTGELVNTITISSGARKSLGLKGDTRCDLMESPFPFCNDIALLDEYFESINHPGFGALVWANAWGRRFTGDQFRLSIQEVWQVCDKEILPICPTIHSFRRGRTNNWSSAGGDPGQLMADHGWCGSAWMQKYRLGRDRTFVTREEVNQRMIEMGIQGFTAQVQDG